MPRDELEGVLAHELMHVKHRDILIGSVAAAIATAISFIANMAMWAGMFGGGDDDDRPNPIVLIAGAILAPIAAGLLQMALSRSREFDADRGGAGSARGRAATGQRARAHRGHGEAGPDAGEPVPGRGLDPQPARRGAQAQRRPRLRPVVLDSPTDRAARRPPAGDGPLTASNPPPHRAAARL